MRRMSFVRRILRRGVLAAVVLSGLAGAIRSAESSAWPVDELGEVEWQEVPTAAEKVEILRMLAEQIKGNYEKIQTWSGTFRFDDQILIRSQKLLDEINAKSPGGPYRLPLHQLASGGGEFTLDVKSDSLHSTFVLDGPSQFYEADTGRLIPTPMFGNVDHRSIVTPNEYLSFRPNQNYRRLKDFDKQPGNEIRSRAAFRDPPSEAANQCWGYIIDPRGYFGLVRPPWEEFGLYIGTLQEKDPERRRRLDVDNRIKVWRSAGGQRSLYKTAIGGQVGAPVTQTYILDGNLGYNAVRWQQHNSEGKLEQRYLWDYELVEDVRVFKQVQLTEWIPDTEEIRFRRTLSFDSVHVNDLVSPATFAPRNLGLKEGERLADHVNKQILIQKDGQMVSARALAEPNGGFKRGWLIGALLASVIALIWLWIRLRNGRHVGPMSQSSNIP